MANDDPISRLAEALERSAATSRGPHLNVVEILATLTRTAGGPAEPSGATRESLALSQATQLDQLVGSLDQTRSVQQVYIQAQDENTSAILQNGQSRVTAGESKPRSDDGGVFDAVVSRFVLSPIANAIVGLFGGRSDEARPPLPRYSLPSAIRINAGYSTSSDGVSRTIDYGQDGLPRVIQAAAPSAAPQITVQVQAIDSRSFLDHSEDIARAVRHAVLNSHTLNDVVSEL